MTDRTEEILRALASGDWSGPAEATHRHLDRIRGLYRKGMVTRREAADQITALAYEWRRGPVFRALDLRLPLPEAEWAALRRAWLARKTGEPGGTETPEPRQRLLDLLEALALPVFLLEPVPGWVEAPRWLPVYTGGVAAPTAKRVLQLRWTRDEGLFGPEAAPGRTYHLESAEGVSVCFTLERVEDPGTDRETLVGSGSVEDFTRAGDRQDPSLRLSRDGILVWQEDEADRAVYESSPRWQPYLSWCRQAEDKRALWLSGLLDR